MHLKFFRRFWLKLYVAFTFEQHSTALVAFPGLKQSSETKVRCSLLSFSVIRDENRSALFRILFQRKKYSLSSPASL